MSARAYISGLGYYQLYIDGERVGTSRLDPGWTTYDHTVLYACYDVTSMVSSAAEHIIGVELGNGWWNPLPLLFWGHDDLRAGLMSLQGRTSSEPMFKLLVLATMSDGSEKVLATSTPQGWKSGMCVHVGIAGLSLIGRQHYSFACVITILPPPMVIKFPSRLSACVRRVPTIFLSYYAIFYRHFSFLTVRLPSQAVLQQHSTIYTSEKNMMPAWRRLPWAGPAA